MALSLFQPRFFDLPTFGNFWRSGSFLASSVFANESIYKLKPIRVFHCLDHHWQKEEISNPHYLMTEFLVLRTMKVLTLINPYSHLSMGFIWERLTLTFGEFRTYCGNEKSKSAKMKSFEKALSDRFVNFFSYPSNQTCFLTISEEDQAWRESCSASELNALLTSLRARSINLAESLLDRLI